MAEDGCTNEVRYPFERKTSCNVIQCLNSVQMAEDGCTNEVRYPFERNPSCNVIQCLNSIQMAEDGCTSEVSIASYLSQLMRLWYLSHRRPAKAQASLRIRVDLPEPSLFAHIKYGSR